MRTPIPSTLREHYRTLLLQWLKGQRPSEAVELLKELNPTYDLARLGQWRRGDRPVPATVVAWLLSDGR